MLGLSYPFGSDRGGGITQPEDTPVGYFPRNPDEQPTSNSIMTYGPLGDTTITQNDINALQFLYGIPGTDYHGLYASIEDWFNQYGWIDPTLL